VSDHGQSPGVWGSPQDVNTAIAALREAVESGVNHIHTSDFYGPYVTNQLVKQTLRPYARDLVIAIQVALVEVQTNPGFTLFPARSWWMPSLPT
jgi:pyridoxine 4-dehydrogenase